MIKLEASEIELRAAGTVARNVEIINVSLIKSKFTNSLPEQNPGELKLRMDVKIPNPSYHVIDRTLYVIARLKVTGTQPSENNTEIKTNSIVCELENSLEFRLPEGDIPEAINKQGLPAFAKFNGPYICWPYFRQQINSLFAQANFSGITLPVLTVTSKLKKKASK